MAQKNGFGGVGPKAVRVGAPMRDGGAHALEHGAVSAASETGYAAHGGLVAKAACCDFGRLESCDSQMTARPRSGDLRIAAVGSAEATLSGKWRTYPSALL